MLDLCRALPALALAALSLATASAAPDVEEQWAVLRSVTQRPEQRIAAAKAIAEEVGPGAADEFIAIGRRATTPPNLRGTLARLLAGFADPATDAKVVAGLAQGNTDERVFLLRAAQDAQDEKTVKELCKRAEGFLGEKDPVLRAAALRLLVERERTDAIGPIEKMLKKEADPTVVGIAISGLTRLYDKDITRLAGWEEDLVAWTRSKSVPHRNAALAELGHTAKRQYVDVCLAALADPEWSTRLAALSALLELGDERLVPALIARMRQEEGRVLEDMGATLERLTGRPLGTDVGRWEEWWKLAGADFEMPERTSAPSTKRVQRDKKIPGTKVEFLGLPVSSRRVVFVVDISGSMQSPSRGLRRGETGGGSGEVERTRLEVVKEELVRVIDNLEDGALFNVVVFEDNVTPWLEGGMEKPGKRSREDAKAFVLNRYAAGGTNIYDAVRRAFADPVVDTIYLLSDGDPSTGDETEPDVIREHVAQWNATRKVRIHCIAVGGSRALLRNLATDSGGEYVHIQ